MEESQKTRFVLYVLEKLEVVNIQERRNAAQSLLYLVQGVYKEQEDYNGCLELVYKFIIMFLTKLTKNYKMCLRPKIPSFFLCI